MEFTLRNEQAFDIQVAKTILNQMKLYAQEANCTDVLWSWGWEGHRAVEIDGKAGLAFRVRGFRHKGWVFILLNEASDLYEIYTAKGVSKTAADALKTVKCVATDIFFDMLVDIIDKAVETGDMTKEQYKAKCAEAIYRI